MITFDILTIFPEMFPGYFDSSMLGRAQKNKLIKIRVHNLRDYAKDKHKVTDDTAYGGISGMVMKVEPIYAAVKAIEIRNSKSEIRNKSKNLKISKTKTRIILLSAKGKVLTQAHIRTLSKYDQLILIVGHYKGVDERVAKYIADEELSIGDYVITGGEVPAMIVVDAVSRMIPGVIGDPESKKGESFSRGVRHEHPVYTRPAVFSPKKGVNWKVPPILLSGNHKKIEEWRCAQRDYSHA